MTKLAFLFPGQGSQRVGMGAALLDDGSGHLARHLDAVEAASGLPVRRYCMEGPIESLTRTEVAQPALFAVSMAAAGVAADMGLRPDFVAGHSLGEYTAAAVAGALAVDDAVRLVCERGRLMGEVQSQRPGAMGAIIGLAADRLAELCEEAGGAGLVSLANLNTPTQIVVSGEEAAVARVLDAAPAAGAAKAVRLQVGAAFHTELMRPVQARLAETMAVMPWSDPEVPLAANHSGELVATAAGVHDALVAQIAAPVRWVDCVQTLVAAGTTTFLELGPGRVLGALVRQVHPPARTFAADSRTRLEAFAAASLPEPSPG